MTEENKELENQTESVIIEEQTESGAESGISEDTRELEAYKALYEKQQKALEEANSKNSSLQKQIDILMRNGASVTSNTDNVSDSAPIQDVSRETFLDLDGNEVQYIGLDKLGQNVGLKENVV